MIGKGVVMRCNLQTKVIEQRGVQLLCSDHFTHRMYELRSQIQMQHLWNDVPPFTVQSPRLDPSGCWCTETTFLDVLNCTAVFKSPTAH